MNCTLAGLTALHASASFLLKSSAPLVSASYLTFPSLSPPSIPAALAL